MCPWMNSACYPMELPNIHRTAVDRLRPSLSGPVRGQLAISPGEFTVRPVDEQCLLPIGAAKYPPDNSCDPHRALRSARDSLRRGRARDTGRVRNLRGGVPRVLGPRRADAHAMRTISEGSTIFMKASSGNSRKQFRIAISCAPRGVRARWMLKIQGGSQCISPLSWLIQKRGHGTPQAACWRRC